MKQPNILFLMSDEHRSDVLGFSGNTIVRTPVLDALASKGVIFDNAYTPSPICIPARQCLMSGQLPKTCNCTKYGDDLTPGYETFARALARHNYETVACGKLHHTGTDQMQGWTKRIGNNTNCSKIDNRIPLNPPQEKNKWPDHKEILRAGIGRGRNAFNDEYAVTGALGFIEQYFTDPYYDRCTPDMPVMLKVSLIQPHYQYLCDADKFNYYLNRVKPYMENATDHDVLGEGKIVIGEDVTQRDIVRATAAYYGMIETVDDQFGRVVEALANVGQDINDWIVIFTSDHGEMLGEHGVWEKRKFYDGSAKVPLFISWPKGFEGGFHVNENVNLCDLFATICDLCSVDIPKGLDSRSLVGLLKGEQKDWDNETVSQFGKDLMIKQDYLKYQYYGEGIKEVLFDLKKNPAETENFIDDPAYKEKVDKFRKRCTELSI